MDAVKKVRKIPDLRYLTCKDIWHGIQTYWVNDGPKAVLIVLWVLANLAVVLERIMFYTLEEPPAYHVLGWGVVAARAAAAGIKLNCALILLPVCRNILSWIRGTWLGDYIPVDKAIVFHKYIAWAILGYAILHITAHFVNFDVIENRTDPQDVEDKLGITLSADGDAPTALELAWTTVAGATGHVATIVMIFMYTSAVESVRRPHFEAFWYTHHLFLVFLLLLCVHGAGQLLEAPTFWAWVVGPLALYIIERLTRLVRGTQDTILRAAIQHPSQVIELQMRKPRFNYKPGQYLFLNCPFIAAHEWHPFTISSAPEEDYVGVHIRIVGDWTGKLGRLLNPQGRLGLVSEEVLTAPNGDAILRIDGPYGAASEDIFQFETVMLIGAGIGVTPFSSILKSIRYRIEAQEASGEIDIPVTKVYFYWIIREKNSFEWFFELLSALEESNINNFLEIHTYITSVKNADEAAKLVDDAEAFGAGRDPITGLFSGSHYGRPDFNRIFEEKTQQHPDSHIGVFFCGPQILSKALYKYSRKYTKKTSTKFHYHKENF